VKADVVAIDQPYFLNRLGAVNANGMMYALKRDTVDKSDRVPCVLPDGTANDNCSAGNVALRPDKRPRPIVLRANEGDCLEITFTNWLTPATPAPGMFIFSFDNDFDPDVVDGVNFPAITNDKAQVFAPQNNQFDDQPVTREASIHVNGMQLASGIGDDGSFVGRNASSLVAPGGTATYALYAEHENIYHMYSMGSHVGGEGGGGTMGFGLFGAVIVEPAGAVWYRSQTTHEEMVLVAVDNNAEPGIGVDNVVRHPTGQPVVDYEAVYPDVEPFLSEGKAGLPILRMTRPAAGGGVEIVHTDIHAIITGPSSSGYLLPDQAAKSTAVNPRQDKPFREFASIWNDEQVAVQPFNQFYKDKVLGPTFGIVRDSFIINYGSGGIGSEIIANRLGIGPMHECVDCKAEEFFLTSWAVGDPAMIVDIPAVFAPFITGEPIGAGPQASLTLFPEDPANTHHSYLNDHVKFRNVHAGPFEHHIFHLHAHQWVFAPYSDKANYQDMQTVSPGSGYTMDIANGGSGNRHKTPGDAIYHCHFYPHFAMGMWALWRNHDVFEEGTLIYGAQVGQSNLAAAAIENDQTGDLGAIVFEEEIDRNKWAMRYAFPFPRSRALPDGEVRPNPLGECVQPLSATDNAYYDGLCTGVPIPFVVPMPTYAMAPMPATAYVNPADPRQIVALDNADLNQDGTPDFDLLASNGNEEQNPGFPFWVAGDMAYAGHRPPTPPKDILTEPGPSGTTVVHDGGLPRHVIVDGEALFVVTRLDLNKELDNVVAKQLPEDGTPVELKAMDFHEVREHDSVLPDGTAATFEVNGQTAVRGAPFADPCVDNEGDAVIAGGIPRWWDEDGIANFTVKYGNGSVPVEVEYGAGNPRTYKIANIQLDMILNKAGWHYHQQRMITAWDDVASTYAGTRPPEPFVFRGNTLDCIEVQHTNLTPNVNELDDYQIRFPTDVIGQHTHMPKFDAPSSDGAANGWNYEDGTFSPGEVLERIKAINANGGIHPDGGGLQVTLTPETHPYLEGNVPFSTLGARTTVQRWMMDPVFDNLGNDRGLGNTFTHDHFGPSTFQQLGLYATVLAEPAGSRWVHNETGDALGNRHDGGPTSWQAIILTGDEGQGSENQSYREFYLEFADFQQAYEADWDGIVDEDSFLKAVNLAGRLDASPIIKPLVQFKGICPAPPGTIIPRPCPEAITGADPGTFVVNYRNEPVGLRVFDPDKPNPAFGQGAQADGLAGDLAFAFSSNVTRRIPELNSRMENCVRFDPAFPVQTSEHGHGLFAAGDGDPGAIIVPGDGITNLGLGFNFTDPKGFITGLGDELLAGGALAFNIGPEVACPDLTNDVGPRDPATPMIRAYVGDKVRIRAQMGAHEETHFFSIHGMKWLMNYADPDSGWRNTQAMGISEQFSLDVPLSTFEDQNASRVDYLYATDTSNAGLWNGTWGIFRTYTRGQRDLLSLPQNPLDRNSRVPVITATNGDVDGFVDACPADLETVGRGRGRQEQLVPRNVRRFDVSAVSARLALAGRPEHQVALDNGTTITSLVYNSRPTVVPDVCADGTTPPCGPGGAVLKGGSGPLHDPTAMMYVLDEDLNPDGTLKATAAVEPLILRVQAGECVEVQLTNRLPDPGLFDDLIDPANTNTLPQFDLDGWTSYPAIVNRDFEVNPDNVIQSWTFNANDTAPSSHVGLHTQLLAYNAQRHDGTNVGVGTTPQTAPPGGTRFYRWYAGDLSTERTNAGGDDRNPAFDVTATPVEFGAVGLIPADKLEQTSKGLVGALVVMAEGTECIPDTLPDGTVTRAQATCTNADGSYRDFVAVTQSGVNQLYANVDGGVPPSQAIRAVQSFKAEGAGFAADDEDSGGRAVNYRTEPEWFRLAAFPPHLALEPQARIVNTSAVNSNTQLGLTGGAGGVGGVIPGCNAPTAFVDNNADLINDCDPQTPVFTAAADNTVRLHFVEPGGGSRRGHTIKVHGHVWQRSPHESGLVASQFIGFNPDSKWVGSQDGYGSANFFELIFPAGGAFGITGDYYYGMQDPSARFPGMWGVFRVTP
jgi:hypothetical protein